MRGTPGRSPGQGPAGWQCLPAAGRSAISPCFAVAASRLRAIALRPRGGAKAQSAKASWCSAARVGLAPPKRLREGAAGRHPSSAVRRMCSKGASANLERMARAVIVRPANLPAAGRGATSEDTGAKSPIEEQLFHPATAGAGWPNEDARPKGCPDASGRCRRNEVGRGTPRSAASPGSPPGAAARGERTQVVELLPVALLAEGQQFIAQLVADHGWGAMYTTKPPAYL